MIQVIEVDSDNDLSPANAQAHWEMIMNKLKSREAKHIHKFYSSSGGWAYLSSKTSRFKITRGITFSKFLELIRKYF